MVKAKLSDGTVILGLEEENIKRLKENQPMFLDLSQFGIEQKILIVYGETTEAIHEDLKRHFSVTVGVNQSIN